MSNLQRYSELELRLLYEFGQTDKMIDALLPIDMYKGLAFEAFAENQTGSHVEALRRVCQHILAGGFRGTPEFEELVRF